MAATQLRGRWGELGSGGGNVDVGWCGYMIIRVWNGVEVLAWVG